MSTDEPSRPPGSIAFDPFEAGFAGWPYDQYARLRAVDPVHHSPVMGGWMLTRFDDVNRVLKDPAISTDINHATPTPQTELELERRHNMIAGDFDPLPLLDEPGHTRIRRLMAPAFRKGSVKGLAERIERHVDDLIDAVVAERGPEGEIDLVGDLVYPMPVMVICELMGIPDEDGDHFRRLVQLVALGLDPILDLETRERCLAAGDEMRAYLADQISAKRAEPGDDLTSALVHATDDAGDRLSPEELIAQLQTVYIAGHEPVTATLGNGFLGFLRERSELQRLWDDRGLVPTAVLELLRYDGPNQFVRRVALEDLELSGGSVPAGAVLYACVGAANHDPDEFGADADHLRVDRESAVHHLQLGAGIHACLGTHLARLEIEITLRRVLDRFTDFELARDPQWSQRVVLRSVNDLHLRYTSRRA